MVIRNKEYYTQFNEEMKRDHRVLDYHIRQAENYKRIYQLTRGRSGVYKKNPYYIERERYYELKHFCRQYPIWKKAHAALDGLSRRPADLELFSETGETSDPTFRCVAARERYSRWMGMVEQCAREADPELYKYLMSYVTKGDCYSVLKMRDHIPCCKDVFYETARKFFWLLNKVRD